uniref:Iron-containing alcohol dehydrogenase (Fe-ADH) n=1 Tax=Coptotermes formosanus TaxID=36987 RepID=R4UP44_COPFO|nr:iron-containing alcohol dehydrogenase (Fe-ADH) [Coptotermes formosanus]
MIDDFWLSTLKELVVIGPGVTKPNPSYELVYRLAMSAAFALNFVFTLGKEGCWGIHIIGHQLTAQYGIDHGATLSIVTIPFLESQYEARKVLLARSGEYVFGIKGSIEEQAKGFIAKLKEFIKTIGQPLKVSEWPDVAIKPGDVDKVTKMVIKSVGGGNFGYHGSINEATVKKILTEVIQ